MTAGDVQATDVVPTHTHPDRWPDTRLVPGCDGCASDDPFPFRSDAIYDQEPDHG